LFQLVFGEGCFGSGVSHEPCGRDSGVARRLRESSGSACAGWSLLGLLSGMKALRRPSAIFLAAVVGALRSPRCRPLKQLRVLPIEPARRLKLSPKPVPRNGSKCRGRFINSLPTACSSGSWSFCRPKRTWSPSFRRRCSAVSRAATRKTPFTAALSL
jgi:hypothetical protein